MINFRVKEKLWDGIPRGQWKSLLLRVSQQNATIFITFYLIRHYELTLVSMINNSSTLITIALSYAMLGENKTDLTTWTTLILGFVATLIFLLGAATSP